MPCTSDREKFAVQVIFKSISQAGFQHLCLGNSALTEVSGSFIAFHVSSLEKLVVAFQFYLSGNCNYNFYLSGNCNFRHSEQFPEYRNCTESEIILCSSNTNKWEEIWILIAEREAVIFLVHLINSLSSLTHFSLVLSFCQRCLTDLCGWGGRGFYTRKCSVVPGTGTLLKPIQLRKNYHLLLLTFVSRLQPVFGIFVF